MIRLEGRGNTPWVAFFKAGCCRLPRSSLLRSAGIRPAAKRNNAVLKHSVVCPRQLNSCEWPQLRINLGVRPSLKVHSLGKKLAILRQVGTKKNGRSSLVASSIGMVPKKATCGELRATRQTRLSSPFCTSDLKNSMVLQKATRVELRAAWQTRTLFRLFTRDLKIWRSSGMVPQKAIRAELRATRQTRNLFCCCTRD